MAFPNLRESFPAGEIHRRRARRAARAGKHTGGDVLSESDVRHDSAAGGCWRICWELRRRLRRRMCRHLRMQARMASPARCASGWNCIAGTRCAPRAISVWIRWGSRSKISTRWASGAHESDGAPIDASASLPDGTRFDGVAGLRGLLAGHQEDFVRTFTEKLLAYAIGRGIEYTDLPAIRKIARDAAPQDYRWSSHYSRDRQKRAVQHEFGWRRSCDQRLRRRGKEVPNMIVSKKAISRRAILRGVGRGTGAAAARQHGAGVFRACAATPAARQPLRCHVRAERHDHAELVAIERRRRVRADADVERARAVSRQISRC